MKKIIYGFICFLPLMVNAAVNRDELSLFANTQVDDTYAAIEKDVLAYLKLKGNPDRLPEGHASILLAPMPGEKGLLDETITLLRFSPMQNAAIAEAQLRLVRGFLTDEAFNEYDGIIDAKDSSIDSLRSRLLGMQTDNDDLLLLIQALTATLGELNTKTQEELITAQRQADALISRLTAQVGDVKTVLEAALDL